MIYFTGLAHIDVGEKASSSVRSRAAAAGDRSDVCRRTKSVGQRERETAKCRGGTRNSSGGASWSRCLVPAVAACDEQRKAERQQKSASHAANMIKATAWAGHVPACGW